MMELMLPLNMLKDGAKGQIGNRNKNIARRNTSRDGPFGQGQG